MARVWDRLESLFGPIDILTPIRSFDRTDYYQAEMGPGLMRRVAAFEHLIDPGGLARIKMVTNGIENEFCGPGGQRRVNLDPGALSLERFLLATGKNFLHRVYLAHGVYADLTLLYEQGEFRPLPWTYPDYTEKELGSDLMVIREKLKTQLRWMKGGT